MRESNANPVPDLDTAITVAKKKQQRDSTRRIVIFKKQRQDKEIILEVNALTSRMTSIYSIAEIKRGDIVIMSRCALEGYALGKNRQYLRNVIMSARKHSIEFLIINPDLMPDFIDIDGIPHSLDNVW
jgi:hypothetical protein